MNADLRQINHDKDAFKIITTVMLDAHDKGFIPNVVNVFKKKKTLLIWVSWQFLCLWYWRNPSTGQRLFGYYEITALI